MATLSIDARSCYRLRWMRGVIWEISVYSEIWTHSRTLSTHTLQTHIYRLRQKIEENPAKPKILVSDLGGYRIVR